MGSDGWLKLDMINPGADRLVIRKLVFGEGAERVVYAMREAVIDTKESFFFDHSDFCDPCTHLSGPDMIAKESRVIDEMENRECLSASDMQRFRISSESFHKQFCRTRQMAETIAAAFNSQLAQRLAADNVSVPRITFLEGFVYHLLETVKNGSWTYRELLAEKRLHATLEYKKWNNNAGFVDGQSRRKRKNMLGLQRRRRRGTRGPAPSTVDCFHPRRSCRRRRLRWRKEEASSVGR